jgi:hypothetical protein
LELLTLSAFLTAAKSRDAIASANLFHFIASSCYDFVMMKGGLRYVFLSRSCSSSSLTRARAAISPGPFKLNSRANDSADVNDDKVLSQTIMFIEDIREGNGTTTAQRIMVGYGMV